jgi:hypothetical protein
MSINPNAALVAKQLKEAGLTKAQIAGVLGNFQLESGFNPRINEGGKVGAPMGRGGYGFAQWTGGRQTNLVNFAKSRKMDPGDPNLQTQFLIHELRGPEKRAFESLKGAVSPEESARRFLTDFERAGIPKTKQRQEAARQIYGKLGFLDAPAPGAASPTPQAQKGFSILPSIYLSKYNVSSINICILHSVSNHICQAIVTHLQNFTRLGSLNHIACVTNDHCIGCQSSSSPASS